VQDNIKAAVRTNRPYAELFKANKDDLKHRIEALREKTAKAAIETNTAAVDTPVIAPKASTLVPSEKKPK